MSNVTLDPRMLLDPQIMQLENNDLAIWIKCRLWRVSTWLTKLGLWERSIDDAGWILNTMGADQ